MQITILFDSPFYIALVEQERDGLVYAARHIFGPEPNNEQVYAFVLDELTALCRGMTAGVPVEEAAPVRHTNPKRMQREVRRQMARDRSTSKAHDAIRQQREVNKKEKRQRRKADRDAEREYKRARKREKAKKKHKGR